MPTLVMKFGGTSVANLDRIARAAKRVAVEVANGYDVIVIVSAMSGKTNELVGWVNETSPLYDAREYDAIVSLGRKCHRGLMALRLQEMDIPARSWQGWQVPVMTTSPIPAPGSRTSPQTTSPPSSRRHAGRRRRWISGRQPRRPDHHAGARRVGHHCRGFRRRLRGRTLRHLYRCGRRLHHRPADHEQGPQAGQDRVRRNAGTGVAWGQGSADPLGRAGDAVQSAPAGAVISFEEPSDSAGTLVCAEEEIMESNVVAGVAYSRDEAKMTLISVADRPGIAAAIFGPLSEAGVNVDMIVQNISEEGRTDMTFSCPVDQVLRAEKALADAKDKGDINYHDLIADEGVAKVRLSASACAAIPAWLPRCSASCQRGSEHQGHHHLGDQDFRADRQEIHGTCGAGPA